MARSGLHGIESTSGESVFRGLDSEHRAPGSRNADLGQQFRAVTLQAIQEINEGRHRAQVSKLQSERDLAEEGRRTKAELIQMLSHDVRSPLSTIRNAATVLAGEGCVNGRQCSLDMINRAIGNILALVDQVLAIERIDAGQMRLEVEHMDLRTVLATTVEQFETLAREKGVALYLRIDEAVPTNILADSVKIGQIMGNLASNAIRFTSTGAVIVAARMRVVDGLSELELSVEDSGIGIAGDRIPAIFDTFIQASADTGRLYGGFGLGLAICRRLVALHGGTLEVQSSPGIGSRFWFVIGAMDGRALSN